MEFEQQQLGRALADANEEPTEKTILFLAGRLRTILQRHRARRAEREQVPQTKAFLEAILKIRNSLVSVLQTLDEPGVVEAECLQTRIRNFPRNRGGSFATKHCGVRPISL
jgi:hypothetical protein